MMDLYNIIFSMIVGSIKSCWIDDSQCCLSHFCGDDIYIFDRTFCRLFQDYNIQNLLLYIVMNAVQIFIISTNSNYLNNNCSPASYNFNPL